MARRIGVLVACAAGGLALLTWGQGSLGSGPLVRARPAAAPVRPAGALVFVNGSNRLTAIDVSSGEKTVRRIRSVAQCGPELFVTGGRVIFAGIRGRRTVVYSVPLALDRPPTRLGTAHAFVPSATPGRVWLAGTRCTWRKMVGVREVSVDGEVTAASRRRVPGDWIDGAVTGGLVIHKDRATFVWDPRTGGSGTRFDLDAIDDARGPKLVGCSGSAGCRGRVIVDTERGTEVVAHPPRGRLDWGVALSPDGAHVAAPARAHGRWRVALIDTRDGTTSFLPGSRTGAVYPAPSWSPSSGWLFFPGRHRRVMAYRPGAARAIVLPFRLPRQAVSFTAG